MAEGLAVAPGGGENMMLCEQRARCAFVTTVFAATQNLLGQPNNAARLAENAALIGELAKLCEDELAKGGGSSDFLDGLMQDISGQVCEALSKTDFYTKWGRHYLPSLVFAHKLEMCNNFKDPGVQNYGGDLFKANQDMADAAFNELPAPKPSVASRSSGYSAPVVSMAAYNDRY